MTSYISFLSERRVKEIFSFSSHHPLLLAGASFHSYPAPFRFHTADRTSSSPATMFDVSWVDTTRETVGQRKSRKEQSSKGQSSRSMSRRSSIQSSTSGSTESPSIIKTRPSLLNLFGSVKTPPLTQNGPNPKTSGLRTEEVAKASRRISSYTVTSDTSSQGLSGPSTTTRFPASRLFTGSFVPDDHSTPSEGMFVHKLERRF